MDRRNFIKVCSVSALAVAAGAQDRLVYADAKEYAKVKLVDADGKPLKASSLSKTEAYVFNYPYAGTPCFLINLPKAAETGTALKTTAGEDYTFAGGVGADKTVVAYLAVCSHQQAYPKKKGSVISYTAGESETAGRAATITCCAHNSAFDPAVGAKPITGKATQPLAAVRLEHDPATDELYATGMYGANLIDDFFKKFKAKLNEEMGVGKYREEVKDTAATIPLSKYSGDADSC